MDIKPVAYAYIRVSTEEQLRGDGPRRQIEGAIRYAAAQGFNLPPAHIIQDQGKSAFTGKNVSKGNLGRFMGDVKAGKIPVGTHLIVESRDRLTRQGFRVNNKILDVFFDAGIVVHPYQDGHGPIDPDDIGDHIKSVVESDRANSESKKKVIRQRGTWEGKRANAASGPLTARCPAWLILPKLPRRGEKETGQSIIIDRKFTVNKERAKVVRKIFEYSASGLGNYLIVQRLNQDKVPTFGLSKSWAVSSIANILNNHSVLGEFQPCKQVGDKREPDGEPIPNYYPRIIDDVLFYRAQDARDQRITTNGKPMGGRKGKNISNLFSGIIKCAYCHAPMYYEDKGHGDTYLVCHGAETGNSCERKRWRYQDFESSFIDLVRDIDINAIAANDAESKVRQELDNDIAGLRGELTTIEKEEETAFELAKRNIELGARKAQTLQQRKIDTITKIESKEKEQAILTRNARAFSESKEHFNKLNEHHLKDYKVRVELSSKIKSLVEFIAVAPVGIAKKTPFSDVALKDAKRYFMVYFRNPKGTWQPKGKRMHLFFTHAEF